MKKVFVFLIFLQISRIGFSQQTFWEITGKIMDDTKKPVEFANVFANNTSFGTVSDSNGSFKLKIPVNIPNIELVVSFAGFQSHKENIYISPNSEKIYTFLLKPIAIQEVVVTAKRDKYFKKKWQIFENVLLGQSDFKKDCEILNSEVIRLEFDEKNNLLASASEPFYVQNNALGYRIRIQMPYLKCDGKKSLFMIDQFFEELKSLNSEQEFLWNKNRRTAYKSSFRNFLVSLANGKLRKDSFEVFQTNFGEKKYYEKTSVYDEIIKKNILPCKISDFYFFNKPKDEHIIFSNKPLLIFLTDKEAENPIYLDYPYKNAMIILPKNIMTFTKNGWLTKSNSIILSDYWSNEGVSVSLPDDFVLE